MNKIIGQKGEDIAAEYLQKEGYTIIERNKHFSKNCEVDIIAKHKKTIIFVEVKTRSTSFLGNPLEAITPTKYQNIKTGALSYLKESAVKYTNFRIDAISIILKPTLSIEHIKNI